MYNNNCPRCQTPKNHSLAHNHPRTWREDNTVLLQKMLRDKVRAQETVFEKHGIDEATSTHYYCVCGWKGESQKDFVEHLDQYAKKLKVALAVMRQLRREQNKQP